MSQATTAAEQNAVSRAQQPLVPPDERFWKRYSPHGELPLSGAGSLAVHLLVFGLMLLSAWLAYSVFRHSSRSLPVEAVRFVGGGGGSRHGVGNDDPNRGSQPIEAGDAATQEETAKPDPLEAEKRPDLTVQAATSQPLAFNDNAIRQIQQIDTASSQAMQKLAQANIRIPLPDRKPAESKPSGQGKGGKGKGGGSGDGDGTGTGGGRGDGASGKLTQREKRMLRWSMLFDTRSGRDYLEQLKGLKAILAIPDAGGKNYKIIRDLSARPAKPVKEDVSKIQRIYWIDDNRDSVRDVMAILGVRMLPAHFVAFMPEELEQKLFELEKAYLGQRYPGRSEDDVEVTRFKINRSGKSFEPEVIGMEVKKAK